MILNKILRAEEGKGRAGEMEMGGGEDWKRRI